MCLGVFCLYRSRHGPGRCGWEIGPAEPAASSRPESEQSVSSLSLEVLRMCCNADPSLWAQKRSQRFTVQRNAGPQPPLPGSDTSGSAPLNAASRDFNPVVGSMPGSQPDLVAPTPSGLAVPGSLPPRAPSPTSASLLPGQEESSDEIIPTALVLKNISFHASQEQMLALMVRQARHRKRAI